MCDAHTRRHSCVYLCARARTLLELRTTTNTTTTADCGPNKTTTKRGVCVCVSVPTHRRPACAAEPPHAKSLCVAFSVCGHTKLNLSAQRKKNRKFQLQIAALCVRLPCVRVQSSYTENAAPHEAGSSLSFVLHCSLFCCVRTVAKTRGCNLQNHTRALFFFATGCTHVHFTRSACIRVCVPQACMCAAAVQHVFALLMGGRPRSRKIRFQSVSCRAVRKYVTERSFVFGINHSDRAHVRQHTANCTGLCVCVCSPACPEMR